jgi:MFS family permease
MSLEAAIKQVEADLRTTSGSISLTLSIFIVVQGGVPLLWTAISEIKGRKVGIMIYFIRHLFAYREAFWTCRLFKLVYIVSLVIAIVGNIVAAEAKSIGVLIGMRVIQAIG